MSSYRSSSLFILFISMSNSLNSFAVDCERQLTQEEVILESMITEQGQVEGSQAQLQMGNKSNEAL